ncbi:hypothetical protein Hanom_Chr00s000008g01615921 [Helianthus anomalus]
MDGVNEPDENGKISKLLDTDAKKTNLWTKVAKLAKPQEQNGILLLCKINRKEVEYYLTVSDICQNKIKPRKRRVISSGQKHASL